VRQNTPSDSVYIVVSGRFEVWVEGQEAAALKRESESAAIGETGFFFRRDRVTPPSWRPATPPCSRSTVHPSIRVAREVPAIYQTLRARGAPAGRRQRPPHQRGARGRGRARFAVIAGGDAPIPAGFLRPPCRHHGGRRKGLLLTRDQVRSRFPGQALDDPTVLNWLNAIENEYELIAYRAETR